MPVTRRKDTDLSESLRHDADAGPVITPHYTVLSRADWERLVDRAADDGLGKIARERRNDPITGTWDEIRKKHGL